MPEKTAAPSPPHPMSTKPTTNGSAIPRNPMPPTGCRFGERIVAHVMRDATGFGERRQLEDAVGAEDVFVPHPRAHFDIHDEQVVVDEAAGAVAAQRFLIGEQALVAAQPRLRPERHLVAGRLVFVKNVAGKRDALADRCRYSRNSPPKRLYEIELPNLRSATP